MQSNCYEYFTDRPKDVLNWSVNNLKNFRRRLASYHYYILIILSSNSWKSPFVLSISFSKMHNILKTYCI